MVLIICPVCGFEVAIDDKGLCPDCATFQRFDDTIHVTPYDKEKMKDLREKFPDSAIYNQNRKIGIALDELIKPEEEKPAESEPAAESPKKGRKPKD